MLADPVVRGPPILPLLVLVLILVLVLVLEFFESELITQTQNEDDWITITIARGEISSNVRLIPSQANSARSKNRLRARAR
jgi:hypothetical protein